MISDTICSIITPLYNSSIGIIRISGSDSLRIVDRIFTPFKRERYEKKEPYTIHYGSIKYDKELEENALVLIMRSPNSLTGEDVIELQCHGNPIVLQKILKTLLSCGAYQAEPGEFLKRAFLNGKIDLVQSEAVNDLIFAKSDLEVKRANEDMQGRFSNVIIGINKKVIKLLANAEALIDFGDDDNLLSVDKVLLKNIALEIEELLKTFSRSEVLKRGIRCILIGPPNSGKSSILNGFLKRDRAIVSNIPGTTRDTIEEYINLGDISLNIVDTAGIRKSNSEIENIGINRALNEVSECDLVLFIKDITNDFTTEEMELLESLKKEDCELLIVYNKIDLKDRGNIARDIYPGVEISAREKLGLDDLINKIKDLFLKDNFKEVSIPNLRCYEALVGGLDNINSAIDGLKMGLPFDLISIDLRSAYLKLSEITGEVFDENLIDSIFKDFCIGK